MMPDLFAATVVCDTSTLRGTGSTSAPYQVLKGLVSAGLVNVLVPELVLNEFRTQWRDRIQSDVVAGLKAFGTLSNDTFITANSTTNFKNATAQITSLDLEALSLDYAAHFLSDSGFQLFPLSFDQANDAWKRYFLGQLPSNKVKFRADIPDAHVLAAMAEITKLNNQTIFVCADKPLRQAAEIGNDVICFDSFASLIASPILEPFVAKWQLEEKWKLLKTNLNLDPILDRVQGFVMENGGNLLSYKEVTDPQIPEDNRTASIAMYGEPEEIEASSPEDWGGGFLRYSVSYFSECLLSFNVFRADAFDVPEWVSVTIGDPETDHYFEAEGYAVVIVNVDVTVRVNLNATSNELDELIDKISFDNNSLDLSLSEA